MSYLKTIIKKAGTLIGVRRSLNFIQGANITLTMADDTPNDRVNITIDATGGGGAVWGAITGTLASQTDLAMALNGKHNTPTGTPTGTKYLRDDNSWQPVSGGSGLQQYQIRQLIRR